MSKPGLLPPRAFLMSLAFQLPLILVAWPPSPRLWMLTLGAALLASGIVLNLWAERLFRRGGVGVCPFSPAPQLVRSGPYRLTRNPMYLGMVFLGAGVALATGTPLNLISPAVFGIWLHYRYVLPEEAFLRANLGAPYDDFFRGRPRWLGVPTVP